jgi:diguanylate cyclase (GGDEF)-like protein
MITRIAKSVSIAIKVAVISFNRAFNENHDLDDILGYNDELTQLPNFKAFRRDYSSLNEEHALVLIDVDNFKLINDYYGHAFGNLVLKRIAFILNYSVAFCGRAYRLHGDEFALIIKRQEVERICGEIHSHFRKEDSISLSQGVVIFEGESVPFDKLFKAADKALYQSKNNGKGITTMIPVFSN